MNKETSNAEYLSQEERSAINAEYDKLYEEDMKNIHTKIDLLPTPQLRIAAREQIMLRDAKFIMNSFPTQQKKDQFLSDTITHYLRIIAVLLYDFPTILTNPDKQTQLMFHEIYAVLVFLTEFQKSLPPSTIGLKQAEIEVLTNMVGGMPQKNQQLAKKTPEERAEELTQAAILGTQARGRVERAAIGQKLMTGVLLAAMTGTFYLSDQMATSVLYDADIATKYVGQGLDRYTYGIRTFGAENPGLRPTVHLSLLEHCLEQPRYIPFLETEADSRLKFLINGYDDLLGNPPTFQSSSLALNYYAAARNSNLPLAYTKTNNLPTVYEQERDDTLKAKLAIYEPLLSTLETAIKTTDIFTQDLDDSILLVKDELKKLETQWGYGIEVMLKGERSTYFEKKKALETRIRNLEDIVLARGGGASSLQLLMMPQTEYMTEKGKNYVKSINAGAINKATQELQEKIEEIQRNLIGFLSWEDGRPSLDRLWAFVDDEYKVFEEASGKSRMNKKVRTNVAIPTNVDAVKTSTPHSTFVQYQFFSVIMNLIKDVELFIKNQRHAQMTDSQGANLMKMAEGKWAAWNSVSSGLQGFANKCTRDKSKDFQCEAWVGREGKARFQQYDMSFRWLGSEDLTPGYEAEFQNLVLKAATKREKPVNLYEAEFAMYKKQALDNPNTILRFLMAAGIEGVILSLIFYGTQSGSIPKNLYERIRRLAGDLYGSDVPPSGSGGEVVRRLEGLTEQQMRELAERDRQAVAAAAVQALTNTGLPLGPNRPNLNTPLVKALQEKFPSQNGWITVEELPGGKLKQWHLRNGKSRIVNAVASSGNAPAAAGSGALRLGNAPRTAEAIKTEPRPNNLAEGWEEYTRPSRGAASGAGPSVFYVHLNGRTTNTKPLAVAPPPAAAANERPPSVKAAAPNGSAPGGGAAAASAAPSSPGCSARRSTTTSLLPEFGSNAPAAAGSGKGGYRRRSKTHKKGKKDQKKTRKH